VRFSPKRNARNARNAGTEKRPTQAPGGKSSNTLHALRGLRLVGNRALFLTSSSCDIVTVMANIIMAAMRSKCGHYIFVLWFLLFLSSSSSSYFFVAYS